MAGASNSFDGGISGQAITSANSVSSGDAFSDAENATYSSAQAHRGLLSAQIAPDATGYVMLPMSGSGLRWARCYARASTIVYSLLAMELASGVQFGVDFGEGQAVLWKFTPPFVTTTMATQSFELPNNAWFRVELQATSEASGEAIVRLYNLPEAITPTVELSGSLNGASSTWTGALYGAAHGEATAPVWVDSVAWSDAGWVGALLDSAPGKPLMSVAAAHRAARW
ncbi:hypothetical protein ABZ815_20270 [Nonomuraea sp. NPDC047529]|uniref:hypothetical protein n=1 Tax=Nonomuraea sp. NPDC047529 TaxID=3155623 RepID=UPI0033D20473